MAQNCFLRRHCTLPAVLPLAALAPSRPVAGSEAPAYRSHPPLRALPAPSARPPANGKAWFTESQRGKEYGTHAMATLVNWGKQLDEIAHRTARTLATVLSLVLPSAHALAGDWPQWGGSDGKNMASEERGLPTSFVPGEKDPQGSGIRPGTARNVQWCVNVGQATYSTPTVAGGKVFIGTCIDSRGTLKCLDARNGKLLWQWTAAARDVPEQLAGGKFCFRNHPRKLGLTSSPTAEGDRVYFVTHRCEVVCLDANGAAQGGLSPSARPMALEASPRSAAAANPASGQEGDTSRQIWSFDMYEEVGTRPADACHANVLIDGEILYVCTCNGVDRYADAREHGELRTPPAPLAPSLIALKKRTGRLVATDDAQIGPSVLHGQWSSPSLGTVGGRKLVFFGGGDGVCYAFEALTAVPEQPVKLKTAWTFDCNPPEYKEFGGLDPITHFARGDQRRSDTINENDGTFMGLNAFIASPVFYEGRVYVPIGQDPSTGGAAARSGASIPRRAATLPRREESGVIRGSTVPCQRSRLPTDCCTWPTWPGACTASMPKPDSATGSTRPMRPSGPRPWWRTERSICLR